MQWYRALQARGISVERYRDGGRGSTCGLSLHFTFGHKGVQLRQEKGNHFDPEVLFGPAKVCPSAVRVCRMLFPDVAAWMDAKILDAHLETDVLKDSWPPLQRQVDISGAPLKRPRLDEDLKRVATVEA
eukprot:317700-Amphidinium_carterae.1